MSKHSKKQIETLRTLAQALLIPEKMPYIPTWPGERQQSEAWISNALALARLVLEKDPAPTPAPVDQHESVRIVDALGLEDYTEIDLDASDDQIELSIFTRRETGDERLDCKCEINRVLDRNEAGQLYAALGRILGF